LTLPVPSGLFWVGHVPDALAHRRETRVYAVRARAGLWIIDSVITTTAQIDALNWPT
jgi:hypothetical protein